MKKIIKKFLPRKIMPETIARGFAKKITDGQVVLSGPFKGMQYSGRSVGSQSLPKTFGLYEMELHQIIEEIISSTPKRILIVGAAEGYYVTGLALRCPDAEVVAYEQDAHGRDLIRLHCEANRICSRVRIEQYCDKNAFISEISTTQFDLVVMDIEGGEYELLQLPVASYLNKTTMLVELHPWVNDGIFSMISNTFLDTHYLKTYTSRYRQHSDISFLPRPCRLLSRWILPLLTEYRPQQMQWVSLLPTQDA